jgi:hypothetical protein
MIVGYSLMLIEIFFLICCHNQGKMMCTELFLCRGKLLLFGVWYGKQNHSIVSFTLLSRHIILIIYCSVIPDFVMPQMLRRNEHFVYK